MRALLLFAGFAALAAFAQDPARSDDYNDGYRKGYKDGFRDGLREAEKRPMPPPAPVPPPAVAPPRPTGPITVTNAVYGSPKRSCVATNWLARRVNGRISASVEVSNEICGDPAKGDRKSLEVTYICGSIVKTASAYEHRTLYLDCTS